MSAIAVLNYINKQPRKQTQIQQFEVAVHDRKAKDKIWTDTKSYKNASLCFQSCGHITKEFRGIPLTVC